MESNSYHYGFTTYIAHVSAKVDGSSTFCDPPGVLPYSDFLVVHFNNGVASHYSQWQLVLGKEMFYIEAGLT